MLLVPGLFLHQAGRQARGVGRVGLAQIGREIEAVRDVLGNDGLLFEVFAGEIAPRDERELALLVLEHVVRQGFQRRIDDPVGVQKRRFQVLAGALVDDFANRSIVFIPRDDLLFDVRH